MVPFVLLIIGSPAQQVSPALVCLAKEAVRHRDVAWDEITCEIIADEMNKTFRPRTTLAMAILESHLRPEAVAKPTPDVLDIGLLGVRCRLGADGLCAIGPAAGYSPEDLKLDLVNIRVASAIMDLKRDRWKSKWLDRYGGCRSSKTCAYSRRVKAMEAALSGRKSSYRGKRSDVISVVRKAVLTPRKKRLIFSLDTWRIDPTKRFDR